MSERVYARGSGLGALGKVVLPYVPLIAGLLLGARIQYTAGVLLFLEEIRCLVLFSYNADGSGLLFTLFSISPWATLFVK